MTTDSQPVDGAPPVEPRKTGLDRRRFLAIGSATALSAAVLTACSKTHTPGAATVAATTALGGNAAKSGRNHYYWVSEAIGDPFYTLGKQGMQAAAKIFGFKASLVGPQNNSTADMTAAFQNVLNLPDTAGILSYYQSPSSAGPLYQAALDKKIPIIDAAGQWGSPRLSYVTWSIESTPTTAAQLIAKALNGSGRVGYISNLLTPELKQEADIFEQQVTSAGLKFVGRTNYTGSASDGVSRYSSFVQANRPDAMWWGDGSGGAVINALLAAGPNIKIVLRGFDNTGLQAIKAGKILGSVDRNEFEEEFWGFTALYMAANYNITPPEQFNLEIHAVTQDNVDKFLNTPQSSDVAWV